MGFFSKIVRSVTKPIKKIIKSPIGRAALLGGLGYFAGPAFAKGMGGTGNTFMGRLAGGGWKQALLGNTTGIPSGMTGGPLSGLLGLAKAYPKTTIGLGLGLGTAAAAAGQPKVDEIEGFGGGDEGKGHQAYLNMRKQFGFGDPDSEYYTEPMWKGNQGGRVPAAIGMSVDQESVTRDPGLDETLETQIDLSTVNRPTEEGILDTGTTEQSADSQLIQLIQQLSALGIPMEQLRGRTMEELVEMMVYVSAKMQGGVQEDVMSEQVTMAKGGRIGYRFGDEVQESTSPSDIFITDSTEILRGKPDGSEGGITNTNAAMGTEHPVIPSQDGAQLDMRETGGYQPHGAQEKKDDVRALLAQGEFVVTSDAVKGIGGGDRDLGAKRMYDMMHKWEAMA